MTSISPQFELPPFVELLRQLETKSAELESTGAWPADQLQLLSDAGILGWLIPKQFGGAEVSSAEMTEGYFALSQSCLVTAFVLTQRNAAIQRIVASDNEIAREQLLPKLCTAETFATVGISHLTTSRQHLGKPSVSATKSDDGFLLSGFVPWTTGAAFADSILTGGTLDDGRQILAMVDTSTDGVSIKSPPQLLALNASHTGAVELKNVFVPNNRIIAGPVDAVMKQSKSTGTGSLTTSALALGSAGRSLSHIQVEAEKRPELDAIYQPLAAEHQSIVDDMRRSMANTSSTETALSSESIRQRANSFALRCSQAFLGASKGAGFAKGHPAEQAVREAMFFLVWSCPQPVLTANLRELACVLR